MPDRKHPQACLRYQRCKRHENDRTEAKRLTWMQQLCSARGRPSPWSRMGAGLAEASTAPNLLATSPEKDIDIYAAQDAPIDLCIYVLRMQCTVANMPGSDTNGPASHGWYLQV